MTCPPPAALHASIARLNAEVLSVEPLPFAPKLRASNVAAGIIGNAVSATIVLAASHGSSPGSTKAPMPVRSASAPSAEREWTGRRDGIGLWTRCTRQGEGRQASHPMSLCALAAAPRVLVRDPFPSYEKLCSTFLGGDP